MKEFYKRHWNLITNLALLLATLFIAIVVFKLLIPYFLPFLLGLILAVLIDPIVSLLQRLKLPRPVATGLAMLLTIGSFSALLFLLISKLIVELVKFSINIPQYSIYLKEQLVSLLFRFQSFTRQLPPEVVSQINKNTEQLSQAFTDRLALVAGDMLAIVTGLPNQVIIIFITLIATFFISMKLPKIKQRIISWVPAEWRCCLQLMAEDVNRATIGFLRAQLILALIAGALIAAGLIILHVEYVLIIALAGALVSPIPVLGVGLLFVPWIIHELAVGNMYLAAGLSILFLVVIIVRHSLEPKILGENIGIDPLSVLIALYAGYELVGFYGLILGPFVLIIFNALQKAKAFAWLFQAKDLKCE
ncbi:MAG: sporulation integral membrane protein YtvI [Peptococcaceae bacterium]|nr:MAG: sporulation integral membrane protein YtvI [Peptococcaceae bacterium]